MLVIHVYQGGQPVGKYHFDKQEIAIGKLQGQDIVLPAEEVSRQHARITWSGTTVTVTDSNSTAGTWQRISGSHTEHFSQMSISICGYELCFEIVEDGTKPPRSRNTSRSPLEPSLAGGHPALRRRLGEQLRSDTDFAAFVLDCFPAVYRQFGEGMNRVAKENLLLQMESRARIEAALSKWLRDRQV